MTHDPNQTDVTAPLRRDGLIDGAQVDWDEISDAATKDIRPEMRNA